MDKDKEAKSELSEIFFEEETHQHKDMVTAVKHKHTMIIKDKSIAVCFNTFCKVRKEIQKGRRKK